MILPIPDLIRDLLARRSTPWTFRTTEGIPFRRPPRSSVIVNRLIHNHLHTIPRSIFKRGISASPCEPNTYRSPWTIASYTTPKQGWSITYCVSDTSNYSSAQNGTRIFNNALSIRVLLTSGKVGAGYSNGEVPPPPSCPT